jgi:hypothetical protein
MSLVRLHLAVRRALSWLLLAGSLMTMACRSTPAKVQLPPPYTAFRSPHLLESPPRRVLLMPPVAPPQHLVSANIWNDQLANELRSIRTFEVVVASPALAPVANCLADIQRAQYSEGALAELRNTLRVDAVLFVSFHDCYAYWPPRLTVAVNLVETVNGETIASVDGNWDARDDATRMQALQYAKRVSTAVELAEPQLILQSPHYFGKYVAADVAHAVRMLWQEDLGNHVPEQLQGTQATATSCEPQACDPSNVAADPSSVLVPTGGLPEEALPAPLVP